MAVLGIDIGGSGIKGAPVDVRRGALAEPRFRVETPMPATPDAVIQAVRDVLDRFSSLEPVGVTFPGVVSSGEIRTAANLDKSWIGQSLPTLTREQLNVDAVALNDADAAAVAEAAHGAAKGVKGVVIVLTFGTGVGSGMLRDGQLVPNTELGHLEMDGKDAEDRVAESVRDAKSWSWKKWAKNANDYLSHVEDLFSPDLLVIGGGIVKKADTWQGLLKTRAPLRVAALGNEAGIVGAAMTAHRTASRSRRATTAAERERTA